MLVKQTKIQTKHKKFYNCYLLLGLWHPESKELHFLQRPIGILAFTVLHGHYVDGIMSRDLGRDACCPASSAVHNIGPCIMLTFMHYSLPQAELTGNT